MSEIASILQTKLETNDTVERCGLVLTDGTVIETENKHDNPDKGFRMSAADLIQHEDQLAGTWHTHPGQKANLSEEDYRGFNQWPALKHYIIGIDGVRCFEVEAGLILEVDLD